jgi:hypothetical protein
MNDRWQGRLSHGSLGRLVRRNSAAPRRGRPQQQRSRVLMEQLEAPLRAGGWAESDARRSLHRGRQERPPSRRAARHPQSDAATLEGPIQRLLNHVPLGVLGGG